MENKLIFIDGLVSLVKQKKELSPLDDEFVKEVNKELKRIYLINWEGLL